MKSLLMAFAPLDQRDATSEGDQALHLAVKAGDLCVVKMLVEARRLADGGGRGRRCNSDRGSSPQRHGSMG